MFIHWGLYSQLGRHEWVMNRERIPVEEYEKLASTWKPKPNAAGDWAKLAKRAGMRYMVMTTKHHEGFCLFDSKLTDYNFDTPEQHITPSREGRAWEACMTFNDSWGYTPIDTNYKSAWHVVSMPRQVAAGGGNLLLNIGPKPDGSVPEICEQELLKVGEWLQQYSPAVYEATDPIEQEWMITGAFTRKGNTLYFNCNSLSFIPISMDLYRRPFTVYSTYLATRDS